MKRAFQIDLGRQIERVEFLVKWLPRYAEWGFDQMFLYLEDAYDFPSVPGVGRHRALTPRQMDTLVRAATRHNIQTVPIVPLLGHTSYLMKVERLRYLSELQDASGQPLNSAQLCPLHADTPKLARKLLRDIQPFCTAGLAHVGLDESFDIGKCPQCRREVAEIGLGGHFSRHIQRLHGVCRDLKLRMGMWSDMLYYIPEAIPQIPKDVVQFDWYYYPFAGMPRIELYNFADVDLTGKLRRAGLEVYGCPNNGPFIETITPFVDRLRNIIPWWDYCHRKNAQGMLITSWAPTRAAIELNFVVDAAAASLWLNPGQRDPRQMLALGLDRVYGKGGRRFAPLAAAVEQHQLTGYYRSQAHAKWAALASFEPLAPWRKQERYYQALAARAARRRAPVALRASLVVRRYLAERDRFIREGSQRLATARRATHGGQLAVAQRALLAVAPAATVLDRSRRAALQATRTLWARSRYADDPDPNETMLQADAKRLAALQTFVKQALKHPAGVFAASPLLGRWQLLFWVRNFAPALQATVVEVAQADGTWQNVHQLWSLEFSADAGVPRANFLRRHSAPFDWDGKSPRQLRLAVRGLGELEIYGLQATDGVRTVVPAKITTGGGPVQAPANLAHPRRPGARLGVPAPHQGFPRIDWAANQAWIVVELLGR